jgi:hypothetical protein
MVQATLLLNNVPQEIALTRSYIENYANDPFLTLKIGQGQPKAFHHRSMGQGTILF